MKIRLIALDLDDTLLRSDLTISAGNRKALVNAENTGIEIVLASGRNYISMREYARQLGLDRPGNYLICSNGAETLAAESGEIIEQLRLSREFCHAVSSEIESRGFPWQVYQDGKIFCSEINPWALRDKHLTSQPVEKVIDKQALFENGQIKFVIPGEPEKIAQLYAKFKVLFADQAEVVTSKPYFLEILPKGADKGQALGRLAERLKIPMKAVMAIGDAMNDLGMIKAAGFGCAPANALAVVKASARHVSQRTNEEDAVADLIYSVAL